MAVCVLVCVRVRACSVRCGVQCVYVRVYVRACVSVKNARARVSVYDCSFGSSTITHDEPEAGGIQ